MCWEGPWFESELVQLDPLSFPDRLAVTLVELDLQDELSTGGLKALVNICICIPQLDQPWRAE